MSLFFPCFQSIPLVRLLVCYGWLFLLSCSFKWKTHTHKTNLLELCLEKSKSKSRGKAIFEYSVGTLSAYEFHKTVDLVISAYSDTLHLTCSVDMQGYHFETLIIKLSNY